MSSPFHILSTIDELIYCILSFVNRKFLIKTCLHICKQWYEQAIKVPVEITFEDNNSFVINKFSSSMHRFGINLTKLTFIIPTPFEWIIATPALTKLTTLVCTEEYNNRTNLGDYNCSMMLLSPNLCNLTDLQLRYCGAGNFALWSLATSPYLENLKKLELTRCYYDSDMLQVLVEKKFKNLTKLVIDEAPNIKNHVFQKIIAGPNMLNLKALSLFDIDISEFVLVTPMNQLEKLSIVRTKINKFQTRSNLPNLTHLFVDQTMDNRFMEDMFTNSNFPKLKKLTLCSGDTSCDQGIRSIVSNKYLTNLQTLRLELQCTETSLMLIANSSILSNLTILDLSNNFDKGSPLPELFMTVCNSNYLSKIREVSFSSYPLGTFTCQALANGPMSKSLTDIDLSVCNIGDEGLKCIVSSTGLVNLTRLSIQNNNLTSKGCKYLAQSTSITNLKTLELNLNTIEDEGVAHICSSPNFKHLLSLDMMTCGLTTDVCEFLAGSKYLNLQLLNLSENDIGDEGVEILAKSSNMTSLLKLELSFTGITMKGCEFIVSSPYLKQLEGVDVYGETLPGINEYLRVHLPYLEHVCCFEGDD